MKEFLLTNKVILISGAAGLIGSEITDALASAGAKIILLDISPINKILKLENKNTFLTSIIMEFHSPTFP